MAALANDHGWESMTELEIQAGQAYIRLNVL